MNTDLGELGLETPSMLNPNRKNKFSSAIQFSSKTMIYVDSS
jgi:hypothetical protein